MPASREGRKGRTPSSMERFPDSAEIGRKLTLATTRLSSYRFDFSRVAQNERGKALRFCAESY